MLMKPKYKVFERRKPIRYTFSNLQAKVQKAKTDPKLIELLIRFKVENILINNV